MTQGIYGFYGKYRFLSNFWMCSVPYKGLVYKSSEHAFQAAKMLNKCDMYGVMYTDTPGQAKRYGRTHAIRPSWNSMRIPVMHHIVFIKFAANRVLADKLLDTGNLYLEETNKHRDNFWGVYKGRGQNHLGKILMDVRMRLQLIHQLTFESILQ